MKLILRNIGMLKEAELNLNGLTVIAGENDNGKSTVGKVIFCIIKAINRYKEDLEESREHRLEEKLREAFFLARRRVSLIDEFDFIDELRLLQDPDATLSIKLEKLDNIVSIASNSPDIDMSALNILKKAIIEIKNISIEPENTKKSIENALKKVFISEFDSNILLFGTREGFIGLYDGSITLIEVKIDADNKTTLLGRVEPIELRDATFVESPLVLNNYDLLIRSKSGLDANRRNVSRLGIPYTTLHIKDLFDKLREKLSFAEILMTDNSIKLINELNSIIDGEIIYDDKDKNFVFKKEQEYIPIKNTASGIKTFGIIQLLIGNGFLGNDSLFIFDEPENHLHPKWQLKLAKVLITLVKNGVNVLISSHSPYMIEALKRFSDADDLENKTNFYLAENGVIENRNRLEDIFELLSQPFDEFRKMDEDILKDE